MPVNAIRNETNFTAQSPRQDLLAAIARRDQAALATLYDQTHCVVFGLLLCLLPERATAEEVLLEVYEEVWREAAQARANQYLPLTWLLRLARQRALDWLRSAPHQRPTPDKIRASLDCAANEKAATENDWLAGQRHQLRRALMRLTAEQRRALELSYFGGLSQTEIAAQLGLATDEVKTLLHTGLRMLKTQLPCQ